MIELAVWKKIKDATKYIGTNDECLYLVKPISEQKGIKARGANVMRMTSKCLCLAKPIGVIFGFSFCSGKKKLRYFH
jgi:hypothetical protein